MKDLFIDLLLEMIGSIISGDVNTIIGLLSIQVRYMGPYLRAHLKCMDFEIPLHLTI